MSFGLSSRLIFAAFLALYVSIGAAADASLHQVYQAAEAGNYRAAQTMMDQVLRDHPNSAKAHFVEAELLAKQGKIAGAKAELGTAERLDPSLAFAKPGAVQELRERLAPVAVTSRSVAPAVAPLQEPAMPWGLILVGVALLGAVIFFLRRRQAPVSVYPAASGPAGFGTGFGASPQPYGPGGAVPMAPAGGGMGSGILGGLATGAAVGVGMVAGEALMHRVLDGGQHANSNTLPMDTARTEAQPQYDMGGNDFGVADASSWDDSGGSSGGDDWS